MTVVLTVFIAYLVLVMIVGALAARHGKTMEGYFLADRGLGSWVTAISSVASSESGWLVLGLVGEAYMWGAKAIWTVPGVLLGYVCNWYVVAPRLRQQSGLLGAITIPDYLEERFRDGSRLLRLSGILIILFCLMFYVAAQFTATGKAFQQAFGADFGVTYSHGVLLGGLITILYTLVGGFRAVSWTDLVQGLLMAFGLIVLPWITVSSVGGFGEMYRKLQEVPPRTEGMFRVVVGTSVNPLGVEGHPVEIAPGVMLYREGPEAPHGSFRFLLASESDETLLDGSPVRGTVVISPGDRVDLPGRSVTFEKVLEMDGGRPMADVMGGLAGPALLGWILGLLGIGLGYPGQPQVLVRYMAARSRQALHRGRIIAVGWGVIALYGAVILGLAARLAAPDLVDPEQAYPSLALSHLPAVLSGVLLAAIISAMMSTADSQLLVVSSAVARDFIEKTLNLGRRMSDESFRRSQVWIPRLTVFLVGALALALALGEVRAVFWFVLFAWSGLGGAFGPPLILALFWKRVTRWGALAGMLGGLGMTIAWKLWWKEAVAQATGLSLYELVPAFFVSLILTALVSLATPAPEDLPEGLEGLE